MTDEEIINRVFSRSQTEGEEHNASNSDIETEMLQDMRYDFAEEINVQKSNRLAEIKLQVESDRQRNEKQTFQTAIIVSIIKARDEDQSVPTTGYTRIWRYSVSVISVPFLNRKTNRPSL